MVCVRRRVVLAAWVIPALLVMLGAGLVAAGSAAARPPLTQCSDNINNNDGDLLTDFPEDPGCGSAGDVSEVDPRVKRLCADGIDNDADGTKDWPSEPQCNSANDNSELNANQPVRACSNTLDDDGDGKFDFAGFGAFPRDAGCNWAAETSEADSQCSDGIDNDGDGKSDYPSDPGCILVGTVLGMNRDSEVDFAQCNDGRDNDGDGKVDVEQDVDCASATDNSEASSAPSPVMAACSDTVDNDGDGRFDYPNDPGCATLDDNDETDPPAPPACADGLDNDGDLRIDLADPGCSSASDNDEFHTIIVINPQGEVVQQLPLLAPFPIIRMRGSADRRGVRISLLSIRAPAGATVSIYCSGPSCPRRRVAITAGRKLVRVRQFERRLRSGTILKIYVTRPGFLGKYTRFRLLRKRAPLRADRCATTPGTRPRSCPVS